MTVSITHKTRQVIVVHGLFGSGESLQRLINNAGADSINVDSTRPWAPNLSEWCDDVTKAHLQCDSAVHIVAHSLGAVPALKAATLSDSPNVLLLNPFLAHPWIPHVMNELDPSSVTVVVGEHDVVTHRQGVAFAKKYGAHVIALPGVSHSGFLPGTTETWPTPVFMLERLANRALGRTGPTLSHEDQFNLVGGVIRNHLARSN